MSRLARWLEGRKPRAPMSLDRWVEEAGASPDVALHTELDRLARKAMDGARARPGPNRDAAFDLLAADALLTYACEAALEADDPVASLAEMMRTGWGR